MFLSWWPQRCCPTWARPESRGKRLDCQDLCDWGAPFGGGTPKEPGDGGGEGRRPGGGRRKKLESEGWAVFRADGVEIQLNLKERLERVMKENDAGKEEEEEEEEEEEAEAERYFIGKSKLMKMED